MWIDSDARRVVLERGEGAGRVPVVEVQDVGAELAPQIGHSHGEPEEPLVVVGPTGAVGLEVGMRAGDARDADEVQLAGHRMLPDPHARRPDPPRQREVERDLAFEGRVAVVGQGDDDVDALGAAAR